MFSGSQNKIPITSPTNYLKSVRRRQTRIFTFLALLTLIAVSSLNAPAFSGHQTAANNFVSYQPALAAGIWDFFSFLGVSSPPKGEDQTRKSRPINPAADAKGDGAAKIEDSAAPMIACGAAVTTRNVPSAQYPTIQSALSSSPPNNPLVINISGSASPYTEQLTIANNCDVTLQGSGANPGSVVIKSPLSLSVDNFLGAASIIQIRGGKQVTINNLTVSGKVPVSGCSGSTYGIFVVNNSALKMTDVVVDDIRSSDSSLYGCGNVSAIRAGSFSTNQVGTLDFTRVTVSNYGKTGIIVSNDGSELKLKDSLIKGLGAQTDLGQNGIQVNSGATATVTNNRIEDNVCDNGACRFDNYYSYGLIVFDSGNYTASGNTFTNNDGGIFSDTNPPPADNPATATITGNTFNTTRYAGIDVWEGNAVISNNFINGGVFDNTTNGPKVGVSVTSYTTSPPPNVDPSTGNTSATLTSNSISGATLAGVLMDDYDTSAGDTLTPTATAHFNRFANNEFTPLPAGANVALSGVPGIDNKTTTSTVAAENNFWGCNTEPNGGTSNCDYAQGLVTYAPWLKLTHTATDDADLNDTEQATITASLRFNSETTPVDTFLLPGNPHLPNAIPATAFSPNTPNGIQVGFSVDDYGAISLPAPATLVDGEIPAAAAVKFTAGSVDGGDKTAVVSSKLDNANDSVNINVNDTIPPTILSITRAGSSNPTSAASVNFTVVFSEAIDAATVSAADFSATLTTDNFSVDPSVSGVSCLGDTCTVTVGGYTGSGTIRLDVPTSATISDTAGNPFGSGGYTSSQTYTIDMDAPTTTLMRTTGSPTKNSPFHFTVSFSKPVSGFRSGDVSVLDSSNAAAGSVTNFTGADGDSSYSFDVAVTSDNTYTVSIPAAAAQDSVGNDSVASSAVSTVYDTTPPTIVSVSAVPAGPTNAASIVFTVTFDGAIASFDATKFVVSGGSVASVSNTGTTYTVTVTPSGSPVTLTVNTGAGTDAAGNANTDTKSASVTYDGTAPTVTIIKAAAQVTPTSNSPIYFTVTFSEPVTDFDDVTDVIFTGSTDDGTLTAANPTEIAPMDGTTYSVAVSGMTSSGDVTVSVPAEVAFDATTNKNTASPTPATVAFIAPPTATACPTTAPYDVVADFNIGSNPNCEFSYGYTADANVDSAFTLYGRRQVNAFSTTGIDGWYRADDDQYNVPGIYKNNNEATQHYVTVTQPTDLLNLHPGINGERSVIRFTVPSAGLYQVAGRFEGLDTTTTDVYVLTRPNANGASAQQFSDTVGSFGDTSEFGFPINLTAGEIVEFSVDSRGNYFNDSTGLTAVITPAPTVSIADAPEVTEGGTSIFKVKLSSATLIPVAVNYETADGSAHQPGDYTSKTGTLSFDPNPANDLNADGDNDPTTQNIEIATIADGLFEGLASEDFTVDLTVADNAVVSTTDHLATGTIKDADTTAPTVQFAVDSSSSPDVSVAENVSTGKVTLTVTRTGATGDAFTVPYTLTDGTTNGATGGTSCSAGVDYVNTGGTVSFAAGDPSKTFDVTLCDDAVYEGNETFKATLGTPSSPAVSGSTTAATVTISDDETPPTIKVTKETTDTNGAELGTVPNTFTVTLSGQSAAAVSFNYATFDGTAKVADLDYTNTNGSDSFAANTTTLTKTISVPTLDDALFEGTENFTLKLSNLSGAGLAAAADDTATGTITDDESQPTIKITANTTHGKEDAATTTPVTFTVTLSGKSQADVTANVSTADVSATEPDDYTALNSQLVTVTGGSLTAPVSVTVLDDVVYEGSETLTATLSSLSGATFATAADAAATGTIDDNETQPTIKVTKETTDTNGAESATTPTANTFTVTLSGQSATAVSFNYATFDGTAKVADLDYTNTNGSDSFAANATTLTKTISVATLDDLVYEGTTPENFTLKLSNLSGAGLAVSTDDTAIGTITDDEFVPKVTLTPVSTGSGNVTEGATATFQANLSGASSTATTVSIKKTDGTANSPADYSLATTSVTFPANSTASIPVNVSTVDDALYEGTTAETFTVALDAVTAGTPTIGSPSSQGGTIADNENCNYTVNPSSLAASAPFGGGNGSFIVTVASGCSVTASSGATFINSVTVSADTGTGSRTVSYTVADNAGTSTYNGAARTGTISFSVNGVAATYTVFQAASPVTVDIQDNLSGTTNSTLDVPVLITSLTDGRGIKTFSFNVSFDPAIVEPVLSSGPTPTPTYTAGPLAAGFGILTSKPATDVVSVNGVSAADMTGTGTLITLKFKIIGSYTSNPHCSAFSFVPYTNSNVVTPAFEFNNGVPAATTSNGQGCVIAGNLSGRIVYGNNSSTTIYGVPNVTLTGVNGVALETVTATSDNSSAATRGNYSLSGFASGTYTVTPSKAPVPNTTASSANPIRTADASLIQQYRLGLVTLTPRQLLAADVDGDTVVRTFDASLIQQYRLLVTPADPTNHTGDWKFIPVNRVYTSIPANLPGQDYDAILLGDVDGDYTALTTPLVANGKNQQADLNRPVNPFIDNALAAVSVILPNDASVSSGNNISVPVNVDDLTGMGVKAFEFDIRYDPAILQPLANAADGSGTLSSGFSIGSNVIGTGLLRVSASSGTAISGPAGVLINVKFKAIGANGTSSALSFDDFIFNAGSPPNMPNTGLVKLLAPTAAGGSLTGKLSTARGGVIGATQIVLTNTRGEVRTAVSNSFGNYRFDGVTAGETYVVTVNSKRYTFTAQAVSVSGEATSLNLIANP